MSAPTIGKSSLRSLAHNWIRWLERIATGRSDGLYDLQRQANAIIERGLFEHARKLRAKYTDDELVDHLLEIREQTILATANIIAAERPDLEPLLHLVTASIQPRA